MTPSLHLSLDEYDHMVACGAFDAIHRKVELIRGEICETNSAGPLHDDLIEHLREWSFRSTDRTNHQVRGQTGMNLPQLDQHPTGQDTVLAIEVADTSLRSDRTIKAELYAEAGIQEYWVVDIQGQCIYVLREVAADGHYGWQRTVVIGEQVSPLAQADAVLDVADLFGVS
jgi:Uma2 family endonuclease